jgi:hypothetical protein
MATIQGVSKLDWLVFGESHESVWAADPLLIGLTAAQCTAYTADVAAARTKYNAMVAARNAALAATQDWYNAAFAMRDNGAALITTIKGFADLSGDPITVYVKAEIPPPAAPTPAGPPTDCTDLTAELTNSGNVELSWKGTISRGQFFSVWRKLTGETAWTQLGSVAAKTFLDTLVPEGITGAQYQVKAHRGSLVSQGCEPVAIIFGTLQMAA